MGMVIVISLPLILFSLLLGFGCFLFGRSKGRREVYTNTQVFGVPTPPPGSGAADSHPSYPQPTHFKADSHTSSTPLKHFKSDSAANV
ncbi:uncharacterized protein [Primulina eburnea]|uniref:uncharacterized protein n=1 Tax=Primulina eburnea TaxID=1245227 RepID=UPI003C6C9D49